MTVRLRGTKWSKKWEPRAFFSPFSTFTLAHAVVGGLRTHFYRDPVSVRLKGYSATRQEILR